MSSTFLTRKALGGTIPFFSDCGPENRNSSTDALAPLPRRPINRTDVCKKCYLLPSYYRWNAQPCWSSSKPLQLKHSINWFTRKRAPAAAAAILLYKWLRLVLSVWPLLPLPLSLRLIRCTFTWCRTATVSPDGGTNTAGLSGGCDAGIASRMADGLCADRTRTLLTQATPAGSRNLRTTTRERSNPSCPQSHKSSPWTRVVASCGLRFPSLCGGSRRKQRA